MWQKETPLGNGASEVEMIRDVVAGRHSPTLFLCVPGDGQLGDHAIAMMMKIGAGMITRTQDVGDLLLMNVNGLPLLVLEAAALKEAPVALEHGVVKSRLFVEKIVVFFVVLNRVRRRGSRERARHGNTLVGVGDFPVTACARLLPDIAFGVTWLGGGERRRLGCQNLVEKVPEAPLKTPGWRTRRRQFRSGLC